MYEIIIKQQDGSDVRDFFTRKSDVIRFIARETGVSQKSIANEIDAQSNSTIYRDNLGWRAEVYFEANS